VLPATRSTALNVPENFAPELTKIGSKPANQLAFAPGVPHTLYDYIGAKIKQPRAFGVITEDAAVHLQLRRRLTRSSTPCYRTTNGH
jgi:hypothetical protein